MKIKKMSIMLLAVVLLVSVCNVAFAAKQVYGSTQFDGARYEYKLAERIAGANFDNIYACGEFRLYAIQSINKPSAYVTFAAYESDPSFGWQHLLGDITFQNQLVAVEGHYFPSSGNRRLVNPNPFDVWEGWNYFTTVSTDMPDVIHGAYAAWISDKASGD